MIRNFTFCVRDKKSGFFDILCDRQKVDNHRYFVSETKSREIADILCSKKNLYYYIMEKGLCLALFPNLIIRSRRTAQEEVQDAKKSE